MSLHIVKSFSRPLALISAALLLHIGGAVAADPRATFSSKCGSCSLGES